MITWKKNFMANPVCTSSKKFSLNGGFFIKEFRDFGQELYVLYIPLFYILQHRVGCFKRLIPTYPELCDVKDIKLIIPGIVFRIIIYYLMV